MIILAMDTATAATSVAIVGPDFALARNNIDAHGHVEALAPMITEVLAEAQLAPPDIDAVACGVGPGPFTGLRVGISTAIAMGRALDRPVAGVCTHDVIAHAVPIGDSPVIVATTARRAETFLSTYDGSGQRLSGPLAVSNDEARDAIMNGSLIACGDAVDALIENAARVRRGPAYPDAIDLAAIVLSRREAGEDWPEDSAEVIDLDPAAARGESTERHLAQRARSGRVLLAPRPLYLRAPDAVAGGAATRAATQQGSSP
jgi:tRNA threonylcarbamoyladenosine biosynthesis protein TsaB